MSENYFSRIDITRSRSSRVGQSAYDYFASGWNEFKGASWTDKSKSVGGGMVSTFNNTQGPMSGFVNALQLGGAAIAGAAGLAAIAGPQAGITAGVLTLAGFIKSTYSDRETAHNELRDYVWNLVDDRKPANGGTLSGEDLKKAAAAAATLMDDGKNQMKLLGAKLEEAKMKFNTANRAIDDLTQKLKTIGLNGPGMNIGSIFLPSAQSPKTMVTKIANEILEQIDRAAKPGGGHYEYARRLRHTGNYLQAPQILSMAMQEEVLKLYQSGSPVNLPDLFANSQMAETRATFAKLGPRIEGLIIAVERLKAYAGSF